ncbi:MAG: hypothetical protein J0H96_05805 [Microbacterium ginsengisoli]|nr:hypothetical protein [Microbacterium ginsengisoli]
MTAQKYRKKPVEVEAIQWDGTAEGATPIVDWIRENDGTARLLHGWAVVCLYIDTLEGTMQALPGDWIIRGVQGEFYPCKPDIFAATYDELQS